MRALLPLLVVVLAGCGSGAPATSPPTTAPPGVATAASPSARLTPPEQAYLDRLDALGDSTVVGVGGAKLIQLGYGACTRLNGDASAAWAVVQSIQDETGVDRASGALIVRAAAATLCPAASVAALDSPPPAATQAPAAQAGPLTTISPGTYEVGTGDGQVAPGKYRSPGPDGGTSCYYARLHNNDGSTGDLIANIVSQGPSIMNVKAGDGYVQVNGCTFTKG